jgi:hypothetical protein
LFGPLKDYAADERGSSAAEFAVWITFMVIPFLNVIDLGFYVFRTMQVREAAQAGAQSVVNICGYTGLTPVATKCTALNASNTIITDAVQSTSLGTHVTLASGTTAGSSTSAPFEGWYCTNTSGALTQAATPWMVNAGTAASQPATCNATVTGNTQSPGDYVGVTVTYSYTPLFTSVSLLSLLRSNGTITQQAWMRLN